MHLSKVQYSTGNTIQKYRHLRTSPPGGQETQIHGGAAGGGGDETCGVTHCAGTLCNSEAVKLH